MGARVYLASIGRFLQVDPIEGGTPNNYVYPTDPVGDFDLDGNMSTAAKWGVGILGAAGVAAACVFGGCEALAGSAIVVRTVAVAGPVLAKVTAWTPRVLNRVAGCFQRVNTKLQAQVAKGIADRFNGGKSRVFIKAKDIAYDLKGKAHFEKLTNRWIPTPHLKQFLRSPFGSGHWGPTRPMSWRDLYSVYKYLRRSR